MVNPASFIFTSLRTILHSNLLQSNLTPHKPQPPRPPSLLSCNRRRHRREGRCESRRLTRQRTTPTARSIAGNTPRIQLRISHNLINTCIIVFRTRIGHDADGLDAVELIPRALDEAAAFFGFGDFVGGTAGDASFTGGEGEEGEEDGEKDGAEMHFVVVGGSVDSCVGRFRAIDRVCRFREQEGVDGDDLSSKEEMRSVVEATHFL